VADTKITALTALTGANTATTDVLPLVDISDTTMAASGTTKKIDVSELAIGLSIANAILSWGASGVSGTTTTRYLFPYYNDALAGTSAIQIEVPKGTRLRNLRVRHNTTAGNGNNIVYTLRKNGVATALTVTIPSTTTAAQDTTNSVTVVAGDRLDIEVTKAASISASPSGITVTLEAYV